MHEPAYIALDEEGHITLYWGDGTESYREVIWRGPVAADQEELILIIEDLKAWAEDNGYIVVVPAYDLTVTDNDLDRIDQIERSAEPFTLDDVDDLLDDLAPLDSPDYDDPSAGDAAHDSRS